MRMLRKPHPPTRQIVPNCPFYPALTAVVVLLESVEARQSLTVHCAAADVELLLLDWLNAVVYQMSGSKMLFRRFKVHLEGTQHVLGAGSTAGFRPW